ncbi:hypothetical protein HNQ35_000179 [Cerasibacillus quisquiliarum]|uniref:Uncharacterized protein n=1 Tax=Cerasibacillus quisquiliarum TaxID=227865 RepID=A0A511UU38_9BACI|nr:hypothetical protein [Cerasibacillus quisquiliarum]MBB5144990.1 hypothetical protein [Cerasibacillus quisquiliarum]GEN30116.1 hypothetical protein CQU01_03540 [Cerasibacillus quisquiliarum]
MKTEKISLMDAYMIETLRRQGVSDAEMISKIQSGDVSSWKNLHDKFDFNELIKLGDRGKDRLEKIILKGYQISFITFPGLQQILKLKFNKIKDHDYQLIDKGIKNLRMKEQELDQLKQLLSMNWVITDESKESNHDYFVTIKHVMA